jgi:hypothetical protein
MYFNTVNGIEKLRKELATAHTEVKQSHYRTGQALRVPDG